MLSLMSNNLEKLVRFYEEEEEKEEDRQKGITLEKWER